MTPADDGLRDDPAARRYELSLGPDVAHAAYDLVGDTIVFTHTMVPPSCRGEGLGTRLVKAVLDDVRRRGLMAIPQCPFVAAYMNAHPETHDLLAAGD